MHIREAAGGCIANFQDGIKQKNTRGDLTSDLSVGLSAVDAYSIATVAEVVTSKEREAIRLSSRSAYQSKLLHYVSALGKSIVVIARSSQPSVKQHIW